MAVSTMTPAERARLVAQWRASSQSQAAFARRYGLHPRTFWGWVRETPRVDVAAVRPPFVPVRVAPDSPAVATDGLDMTLPSGERLHVAAGTSPTWVAAVVTALRASC
jgi:transposase-like protein